MEHAINILRNEYGWTYRQIATAWDVPSIWVYRQLNKETRQPRGEQTLLRVKDIARAKQMRANKMLYKQISHELGISLITAHRWVKL